MAYALASTAPQWPVLGGATVPGKRVIFLFSSDSFSVRAEPEPRCGVSRAALLLGCYLPSVTRCGELQPRAAAASFGLLVDTCLEDVYLKSEGRCAPELSLSTERPARATDGAGHPITVRSICSLDSVDTEVIRMHASISPSCNAIVDSDTRPHYWNR